MENLEIFKIIGSLLAVITTFIYGTGYLTLRARSHVLGTESSFKLLDETYVFAGFRFLLVLLLVLLITSPIISLVQYGVHFTANRISINAMNIIRWIALIVLSIITIVFFVILHVNGVLLERFNKKSSFSALQMAVLGGRSGLSLFLTLSTTFVSALTLLWFIKCFEKNEFNILTGILAIIVLIQLCMLPVFHGALYANRKVRVLEDVPISIKGMISPVCIVDRTNDYATILGRNANNNCFLATIKTDDLNGMLIKKVSKLYEFMENDLKLFENIEK